MIFKLDLQHFDPSLIL